MEDDSSVELSNEGRGGSKREIEVDREHLLNYESDDSSDQMNDSDDEDDIDELNLAKGLSKQKQDLQNGNVWGSSKKAFYGRDKQRDDESSSDGDDEDEYQEAIRLQKVRAQKLLQAQKAIVPADSEDDEEKSVKSEEGDSSSEESII
jgi:hypothetical protein